MAKKTGVEERLIEQLQVKVGTLTETIEQRGRDIFADKNLMSMAEITDASVEFLELLVGVLRSPQALPARGPAFLALSEFVAEIARQILVRGGSMEEFLRYIMFMQGLFLESVEERRELSFLDMRAMLMLLANLFNELMLSVFQTYLQGREETIQAQQDELRQASTPITTIWDGVLTLPIIGTLDSERTLTVMEQLLTKIETERARMVVMDVTGVHTVDSQVAHHLIQMTRAVRLMGAYAILTGIRPDIARALTSLDIELTDVTTRATLSDGLKEAFRTLGIEVRERGT